MAFGSYNSKFPKEEGHNAWLTRDLEKVKDRDTNEFTSFEFTVSSYIDLFSFLGNSNSKAWFKSYPKNMPTLIMSGDMDPVGNYGKGPRYIYKQLMLSGEKSLSRIAMESGFGSIRSFNRAFSVLRGFMQAFLIWKPKPATEKRSFLSFIPNFWLFAQTNPLSHPQPV